MVDKNSELVKLDQLITDALKEIKDLIMLTEQRLELIKGFTLKDIQRDCLIIQKKIEDFDFPGFSRDGLTPDGKEYNRKLFLYAYGRWDNLPEDLDSIFRKRKEKLNLSFQFKSATESILLTFNNWLLEIENKIIRFMQYVQNYFADLPREDRMQAFNYTAVRLKFYSNYTKAYKINHVPDRAFYEMDISLEQLAAAKPHRVLTCCCRQIVRASLYESSSGILSMPVTLPVL